MAYEGYVDGTDHRHVHGWVFDELRPNEPLFVEILADGRPVGMVKANGMRPDLAAAGKGNGAHAFSYTYAGHAPVTPLAARVAGERWTLQRGGTPRFNERVGAQLHHTLAFGLPQAESAFTAAQPSDDEPAIVARLIEAYYRAMTDDPRHETAKPDNWSYLTEHWHRPLAVLLQHRDATGVAAYLRDAHAKGITQGITQGEVTTASLRAHPEAREFVMVQHVDMLVSLGEYLGLLDVECAEQQGNWGQNLFRDPAELAGRISAAIGIPITTPPVIGSAFGVRVGDGLVTGRDLLGLYAALRVQAVAKEAGIASPTVCEIGGGAGAAAYFANRLGIPRYTVIDLPLVGVLQGYFLLRALPGVNVRLYGETVADPAVELLPTFAFDDPARQYDVLLNMDSIPEMHTEHSLAYLNQARRNVRKLFLSINQEARGPQSATARQTVVRDLVAQVGGYDRKYRVRHWIKAGYVEELYAVTQTNG